jgi:aerobic carbon-monoxide dehydrogenase medium subunit
MATLLPRFAIEQPTSVAEASQMLGHFGDDGRAYAGGTELLLAMKQGVLSYGHLIDLKTVPGLGGIERRDSFLRIGALATHRELQDSVAVQTSLPVLADLESRIANPRVRSSGTIGGNLCFAEPHSDPATLLVCLDATVEVSGPAGERTVSVREFLRGPFEVALDPAEILIAIDVPLLRLSESAVYLKVQLNERPTLGLALLVDLDEGGRSVRSTRVTVGSVSPTPYRDQDAEAVLRGPVSDVERRLDDAAEALASGADLVDSLEGDAAHQRRLIRATLHRAFLQAVSRMDRRN